MLSFSKMYNLKLITEDHLDPRIAEIGKKIASILGIRFDGMQEAKDILGYDLLQFSDHDTQGTFHIKFNISDTFNDILQLAFKRLKDMKSKFNRPSIEEPTLEPEMA